jgi:integrase
MRALMGLIKDRHGTYYAQQKVPERLQVAVARVLGGGKPKQAYLKKSLGTKDLRTANVRAKPVQMEFDRVLREAAALAAPKIKQPLRSSLNAAEITRMAEALYGKLLADDEAFRFGGRAHVAKTVEWVRRNEDPSFKLPYPLERLREHGWQPEQLARQREHMAHELETMREALALGDITAVEDDVALLLAEFDIELDRKSSSYRELGTQALRAYVRGLQAIEQRNAGEPVETPAFTKSPIGAPQAVGGTLRAAFDGWKKERVRAKGTLHEYGRAVEMFVQLHGDLLVANIKKTQAREFREALQLVPVASLRTGKLKTATLPELADYGRKHPKAAKVTSRTVNKQLGAVQAVARWAFDKGLVPDEAQWTDPFNKLRLPEERSERTSFETSELQSLFDKPVFTEHKYPVGAHGDAGFWLPILALFSGARQAELGSLTVANVRVDAQTEAALLYFVTSRARGKRLKTETSERVVPVHPEALRLGFMNHVEARRQADGPDGWLFPFVSPDKGKAGVPAFSKWFGRYLRAAGVKDQAKVFHSFRHTVKDALRRGEADPEVREALIGHAQDSSVGAGYGANAMLSRFGAKALVRAVNCISYPGLDLSKVRPFVASDRKKR